MILKGHKMVSSNTPLTPKILAFRTGVTVPTLHFYEKKGLIHSTRTQGNQRRYHRSMARRIAFIQAGQKAGISLSDIKETLDNLPNNRTPNTEDWEKISTAWTQMINQRIASLEIMRNKFTGCIQCGCLSLKKCQIYNIEDEAGKNNLEKGKTTLLSC